MRRSSLLPLAALFLFCSFPLLAADDPTYTALRNAKPDGRVIALSNFTYTRDVLTFTLNGRLHLLQAVDGKTPGAVFMGEGSYTLTPASKYSADSLRINASDEKLTALSDTFDSAVFLGTALPIAAEKAAAPVAGAPDPVAVDRWNDYFNKQKKTLTTNVHVRLLQEIVDGGEPFFFTWVNGKKYPPAVLVVDPTGAESVRLAGGDLGGEKTMMLVSSDVKGGIWYLDHYKSEVDKKSASIARPLADADRYLIDATIHGAELSATTTMTFSTVVPVRVLPISLFSKLRISNAEYATAAAPDQWKPVAVIQEDEKQDADAAVVFPEKLQNDVKYLLRLTYAGKEVLDDAGDGNFTVTRRMSWYPNVGVFNDMAQYEMHFRTPEKFQIVGIGTETENRVDGTDRVAVWKTTNPARVAGFNYGKFKKLTQTDKDSGMSFEVYTNPGTPDIIRRINDALSGQSGIPDGELMDEPLGPSVRVDTGSLAKSALADGINTARTGNHFFGPLAEKRVAITQQSQWFFGQSWPTLIYMPYVAFLNGTQRNTLGLNDAKDFVDNVGAHELAHQWWGHQVGTRTYHDEWLSEGFAEFTASLVAEQTGGRDRYRAFYEKARRRILERPRGATLTNDAAGPISMGWRISTWRNPSAYNAIIYSKGAYVLHMLRMAMWDRQNGDAAFIAMMKDFATTYAGKEASTGDFQRIVDKHATQNLRITNDGKMDWFFNQWVYDTPIPKYESKFDFKDIGGGKYKVTGSVTQSGVPDNFAVVMPMYVHFDKNTQIKFGATMLVGNVTKPVEFEIALPKKPQKFSINAMNDVLAR